MTTQKSLTDLLARAAEVYSFGADPSEQEAAHQALVAEVEKLPVEDQYTFELHMLSEYMGEDMEAIDEMVRKECKDKPPEIRLAFLQGYAKACDDAVSEILDFSTKELEKVSRRFDLK